MAQIPLDAFRILDKKFGWEKSFKELVDDDDNDIALISEAIKASKERFIDPDKEELGDWSGSSQDISKVWLQYFMLQMRINVKSTYILTGVVKRGFPKNLAENHVLHMNEMKKLAEDLFIANTYVHIIFLFWHLYDQESHRGKQGYFDLLFEDQYLTCINTAHEIALEHPMFSKKTVDLAHLERKLRVQWIGDFKQLWSTENTGK